MSHIKKF